MHFNKKLIGWAVVVIIVVGAVYSMMSQTSTPSKGQASDTQTTQTVGSDLLDLLGKLQTVNFSTDIFSDPRIMSLVDFGIVLPTPAIGRPNPFERIGVDIGAVSSAPTQTSPKTGTTTPGR